MRNKFLFVFCCFGIIAILAHAHFFVSAQVQGTVPTPTPTPTPVPTPTPIPTPTATPIPPTPTATPGGGGGGATPTPTPTPGGGGGGATPTPTPTPGLVPCEGLVFPQNFDGVTAPALPQSWQATNASGSAVRWVTSANTSDTPLNNAYLPAQGGASDKRLITPGFTVTSSSPVLSFRNNFVFEYTNGIYYDGGVLEVSSPNINGGAFTDVTNAAVGGSFVSGGYAGTLISTGINPLRGRMAWGGNSGGYVSTIVNLGPNLNGQTTVYLRFRMGTNGSVSNLGWRIDTLSLSGGGSCYDPSATPIPTPSPTPVPPTPTPTPVLSCNEDWELNLDYNPAQAVRGGQVDFSLLLPASTFGHIPNNPTVSTAYQYPDIPVSDASLLITGGGGAESSEYAGQVLMGSADAVVVKFDLWCSDAVGSFYLVKTYTWTVEEDTTPIPPPNPTGTTSDIRYVSFLFMVDADVQKDPLGITLESQVQLRNLKSNL